MNLKPGEWYDINPDSMYYSPNRTRLVFVGYNVIHGEMRYLFTDEEAWTKFEGNIERINDALDRWDWKHEKVKFIIKCFQPRVKAVKRETNMKQTVREDEQ